MDDDDQIDDALLRELVKRHPASDVRGAMARELIERRRAMRRLTPPA